MIINLFKNCFICIIFSFLLTSCNLEPNYTTPSAPIRTTWNINTSINNGKSAANLSWKDFFKTAELQNLITKGLENNRDLRQAALNIETTRAQYRIARVLLPDIESTASMTDQQVAVANNPAFGGGFRLRQFNVNLGATAFEVDVFGRLRNLKEAALEEYFGTEEAAQTIQISLISEIAYTYMTLLANKQQLYLSNRTLASQKKSYDLIKQRFEAGITNQLDLDRAETTVQTAIIDLNTRQRLIQQNHNALELLVGDKISESELQDNYNKISKALGKINSGLPSDLLLNRPDIRQAEHAIRAANANIGAARAAFFPRVTLTATAGFGSKELSSLFNASSNAWIFNPQITMPIFTWGRNQANLDVAKLRKELFIAQYEKAIQTAFKEVSDALIAYKTLDKELASQQQLVKATQSAEKLAKARYDEGIDNYLILLDAVRSSYLAEQELINKSLAKLSNMVTLYAALGGGQMIQS